MLKVMFGERMHESLKTASAHGLHVYAISSKEAYAVISKVIYEEVASLDKDCIVGLISSCAEIARIMGVLLYLHLPYNVSIGISPRDIVTGRAYYEADVVTKMLVRAKLNNPES